MIHKLIGEYTLIIDGFHSFTEKSEGIFLVPTDEQIMASCKVNLNQKSVIVEINNLNWEEVDNTRNSVTDLSEKAALLLTSIAKKVVSILKYLHGYHFIDENLISIRSQSWAFGDGIVLPLPSNIHVDGRGYSYAPLEKSLAAINESRSEEITPLYGMRFLHRAKNDMRSNYMWIDATISAELCIKEALIRKNPDLETLLLEMPSPPLTKLYGSILEKYMGEKSPYLKYIGKGVEKRNMIIHRPISIAIPLSEAASYVQLIECAILHLHKLLYPTNRLIDFQYSLCKMLVIM